MAGDFSKPTTASGYTTFPTEIRDMFADMACWFDGKSTTNYPTGAIRWGSTNKRIEKWNGTAWVALLDTTIDYSMSVSHLGGTAASNYAKLNSPAFINTPTAPTAAADTSTTQLATTAFMINQAASVAPLAPDVTAVIGTSKRYARQDHVHPTNFTATATDIKMNGTQSLGSLTTFPRADHVHPTDTSRQAASNNLSAIAGLTSAADLLPYFTGSGTAGTATFSAFARTLLDDADAATARATLGITAYSAATTTTQGVVELADSTEALGGTDSTRAVTSAGLASAKSLAANGYYKLPGGLIIQWGRAMYSTNTWTTTTFPIAFPNSCQSISMLVEYNGGSVSAFQLNSSSLPTASSFQHYSGPGQTGIYYRWFAIGY